MSEILGVCNVGDIDNRRAVGLHFPRERIHGAAGMVTDVGDFAPIFVDDERLVRRAALQIVVTCELRVPIGLLIRGIGSGLLNRWTSVQRHGGEARSIRWVGLLRNEGQR